MPKTNGTVETKGSRAQLVYPAITYRLGDKAFLAKGWTIKPSNIHDGQLAVTIKSKFAHPVICPWFREREEHEVIKYPNGGTVYFAKRDGTGKIFYPNGKLAIKIEKGGASQYRTRVWVFSSGEVSSDGTRHPAQLCALFDSLGNGVVYDHRMQKKLVYNQNEGMYYDTPGKNPMHWKWHTMKYRGSLSIMNEEDEKAAIISESPRAVMCVLPISEDFCEREQKESELTSVEEDEDKLNLTRSEIEFRENFERLQYIDSAKIMPKTVGSLKPIVTKINKYIALRIYSQSNVLLTFFAKGRQTQLKIGVILNPQEKLKVTKLESIPPKGEIVFPYEYYPAQTKSTIEFKKIMERYKT